MQPSYKSYVMFFAEHLLDEEGEPACTIRGNYILIRGTEAGQLYHAIWGNKNEKVPSIDVAEERRVGELYNICRSIGFKLYFIILL
jgi:hypothetical protein